MADSNVLNAQRYLNAMFGGHKDWVTLDEDGLTGTATMQGIIRAYQIQNGIPDVTGNLGPFTIGTMMELPQIKKMDPNDESSINVCLIQCALFCKGYDAGGITGIYYTNGVTAVRSMQIDAGLPVTGIIDWKVWSGLLSLNWFSYNWLKGDSVTCRIQKALNSDWSDIVGVGPTDGVKSRQTILSQIGALQGAEGIVEELIMDLNAVNFGDATTSNFPGSLKSGRNSDKDIPFNKIAQYGLYFNGFDPGRYDGIFDETMANQVKEFQKFYGLTGLGLVEEGEINVSTMKSLLTSKGDTARKAKACDCATVLNLQQAKDLKEAGFTHVGRYLTGTVGKECIPKYITFTEVNNIKEAGLAVFPIYQDGGYKLGYFKNQSQGTNDARIAILAAKRIGIPSNSIIYFAVDFDCYEHEMWSYIVPYFGKIKAVFDSDENVKKYRVGIYAPRYVCTKVSEKEYVSASFVADMSSGYSCNLGYPMPSNWAFDQFFEETFLSLPSFRIDKDGFSGRDTGVHFFDDVEQKTDEELKNEIRDEKAAIERENYIHNVLNASKYLDKVVDFAFSYNKKINLGSYVIANLVLDASVVVSKDFKSVAEADYNVEVAVNPDGSLTTGCQNQIFALTQDIDIKELISGAALRDILTEIALTVKLGYISMKFEHITARQSKMSISVSTKDLTPEYPDIEDSITIVFEIVCTLNDGSNGQFDEQAFETAIGIALATAAVVGVFCLATGGGGLAILEFLKFSGFLLVA